MHQSPIERVPRVPAWAMVLPAVTLVVGIVIGTVVTNAGGRRDQASGPSSTALLTPTATASPAGVAVQVPAECLQLAAEAATALPPLGDATDAVRNLDLARIQELISQIQAAEPRLRELGDQCRAKAGSVQLVPGASAS